MHAERKRPVQVVQNRTGLLCDYSLLISYLSHCTRGEKQVFCCIETGYLFYSHLFQYAEAGQA